MSEPNPMSDIPNNYRSPAVSSVIKKASYWYDHVHEVVRTPTTTWCYFRLEAHESRHWYNEDGKRASCIQLLRCEAAVSTYLRHHERELRAQHVRQKLNQIRSKPCD